MAPFAYFVLAMRLFPEVGYRLIRDKPTSGLAGMPWASPSAVSFGACSSLRWAGQLVTAGPHWN